MADDTSTSTRHPEVTVRLTERDGNAFAIIGVVANALRGASVASAEVEEFIAEAMSGNYDHLLRTAMRWVNVT